MNGRKAAPERPLSADRKAPLDLPGVGLRRLVRRRVQLSALFTPRERSRPVESADTPGSRSQGLAALPADNNSDDDDDDDEYDFVIIGAGTCGLVVANILSELSGVSVLVIEAGSDVRDNVNVTDPDRQYETVNQTFAANRAVTLRAGKAIGGTSTINGMTYTRTEDSQIDSWESLGNDRWNWDDLFPYYLKSQDFQPSSPAQAAVGASCDPSAVGQDGPVKVGWTPGFSNSSLSHTFNTTFQNIGVPWVPDEGTGAMRGYNVWPKTADSELNLRADSAQSYLWPYTSRSNLKVLTRTLAHRDFFGSGCIWRGDYRRRWCKKSIKATREVIISADALKSPLLLKLSGIGNPDVLSENNIDVQVPLTGVGEHLQDQTSTSVFTTFKNLTFTGYPQYVAYVSTSDIFDPATPSISESISASIPSYAESISAATNGALSPSTLTTLLEAQHSLPFRKEIPIAEFLSVPGANSLSLQFWSALPFSQGNIHISANNISSPPLINPNYFMLPTDTQIQAHIGNYIRKVLDAEPLRDLIAEETSSGLDRVPENGTEEWAEYLQTSFVPNTHPVSTAAMLPRELGGVVASDLRFIGTSNLRVMDASVLPQQLVGYLSSTLYAVAEKAADLIKEDLKAW